MTTLVRAPGFSRIKCNPVRRLPAWADRHRWLLLILMVLFYAASFNGQWRLGPDTAAYATIAHELLAGHGYTHPLGMQVSSNPGLPYLLAGNFWLFGESTMWPIVLLMTLISLATLALMYRLLRFHTTRGTATAVTFLVGLTGNFYYHSLQVLKDMPFLFGLMLFLCGYEYLATPPARGWRRRGWVCIIAGGLVMALFRYVVLVVIAAVIVTALIKAVAHKRWLYLGVALAVLALPLLMQWLVSSWLGPSSMKLDVTVLLLHKLWFNFGHTVHVIVTQRLPRLLWDITAVALFGNKVYSALVSGLVMAVVLGFAVSLARKQLLWGVLVVGFILQWLITYAAVRYELVILLFLVLGWWRASCWLAWRKNILGPVLAAAMIVFIIGMNLGRDIPYLIQQRSTPFAAHYEDGDFEGVPEFSRQLGEVTQKNDWIMVPGKLASVIFFFSHCRHLRPATMMPSTANMYDPVFAVTPMDEAQRDLLANRNWALGPTVLKTRGVNGRVILQLRRVLLKPSVSSADAAARQVKRPIGTPKQGKS